MLELSNSVKAIVDYIDHESRLIFVIFSDFNCFPREIMGLLNKSSSPFQFEDFLYDYALFNCTPHTDPCYYPIPCLSSSRHPVYAFRSDKDINYLPILSCRKMYTVSSVPTEIWDDLFRLKWSEPKCGDCVVKGESCRFKNNTKIFETECFSPYKHKDNKGIVFSSISTFIITQVLQVSSQHVLIWPSLVYKCAL